jgi:hypothetical protein
MAHWAEAHIYLTPWEKIHVAIEMVSYFFSNPFVSSVVAFNRNTKNRLNV